MTTISSLRIRAENKNTTCKKKTPPRSLTEDEVRRLWDATSGYEYLLWRVLILTGARIGEALALERSDFTPAGLLIDESAINGKPGPTKKKKERMAPLPASLRAELEEWLGSHKHNLIFPTRTGRMHRRGDLYMLAVERRARKSAQIPDLTYRMCRTTFTTLFEGDIRDAQEILGHHSPEFTLRVYRKPITERQQAAIEALDKRLNVIPIDAKKQEVA